MWIIKQRQSDVTLKNWRKTKIKKKSYIIYIQSSLVFSSFNSKHHLFIPHLPLNSLTSLRNNNVYFVLVIKSYLQSFKAQRDFKHDIIVSCNPDISHRGQGLQSYIAKIDVQQK